MLSPVMERPPLKGLKSINVGKDTDFVENYKFIEDNKEEIIKKVKDSSTLKVGDIITEKKLQEVFHMLPDQVIPFGEYVGIGMLALIKGNGQEKLTDLPIIPIFYNPSDKIKDDEIIKTITENNKKLESKMNLSIKPNLNPILVEGEVAQDATTGRYFVGDGKTPLTELKPRDDIMIRKYCESAKIARVICGYPGIGKSWLNKTPI